MPYVSTWIEDSEQHYSLDRLPNHCPYCGREIHAESQHVVTFVFCDGVIEPIEEYLEAVFQCPADDCQHLFIAQYQRVPGHPTYDYFFVRVLPKGQVKKSFDEYIETLSPSFCSLWNQSYQAEQSGLKDICGIGYRKALEFLVKDYLINRDPSKQEHYQSKFLGNCIRDDISDPRIKACAQRAAWLGNDEAHYYRRWKDKDVQDLKNLIELTLHWIMMEHLTGTYEAHMKS